MKVFDLNKMKAFPYEERGKNVFYKEAGFKTQLIELPPAGEMPLCRMSEHVVFVVIEGDADVKVDSSIVHLEKNQCLITDPAELSMQTKNGVRILGIQIE